MDVQNPITSNRKGIILAGGRGSRLYPLTNVVSKQLMPIYDKPMIYYPLSVLMMANIKDYLIICNPWDIENFKALLGNGEEWGITIQYAIQDEPNGIAEALLIGEDFLKGSPVALILGDNLFYGENLIEKLNNSIEESNATIFAYAVNDPKRYGVVSFDKEFNAIKIEEKPSNPASIYAVSGLYFYDKDAVNFAKSLVRSNRGELEITDLNNIYLDLNRLKVQVLDRGTAWLDTGTFDSLLEAGIFVKTLEKRQALRIGYPEEIAWNKKWINDEEFIQLANKLKSSDYGRYLNSLINIKS